VVYSDPLKIGDNMTPTPSPAQRRVLNIDGVRLEGWDAKNRPVVSAMLGIPNQLRRWAILRSGEPTNVTEPVTANGLAVCHRERCCAKRLYPIRDGQKGNVVR
jgi:hypothetical protein